MSTPLIIGIDLGTTHCALAHADPAQGPDAVVRDFPVIQAIGAGEAARRELLPSCHYLPGEHELAGGSVALPWDATPSLVTGEFARWQGARVPGRLVASAKSWLCHPGVDRTAAILPWGAPPDVRKISPVAASAELLRHLAAAWDHEHPGQPLAAQEVVITVPASFDEAARALTVTAAQLAGLKKFTLVEEPQAAFYDFLAQHRHELGRILADCRLVLVVDVGGGTTDFTLIQVGPDPAGPVLRRIAVGDHLMLGGDNMDTALARHVEEQFLAGGRRLSAIQWTQLVQATRGAKEALLGAAPPEHHHLSVVAEGSRLLGGTLSARLPRAEVERLIVDGFFPCTPAGETPRRSVRVALQELGLPYAQDPAITRHLAAFLRQHAAAGWAARGEPAADHPGVLPRPDAILLNGGVFNSPQLAARLVEAVSAWWPDAPPISLLPHTSLERAVARGAAYYGLARHGLAQKIGGGSAHALYLGLAGSRKDETPGAVCVVSRGQEEGTLVRLTHRSFHLTLGRPVQFPLLSTAADRPDRPGDLVPITDELTSLPPLHTLLKSAGAAAAGVPVHLESTLTELGTLELCCVADHTGERWRLEFDLRASQAGAAHPRAAGPVPITESMPARFPEARAAIDAVFGPKGSPQDARAAKHLGHHLEKILGPREQWRVPLLRELWGALFAGAGRRRRTADHERVFYQLAGYCLRPGFGYPLDEWRAEQTFKLFSEGVHFHQGAPVWNEFWILWRRVAGGLEESRQRQIWEGLRPHLARRVPPEPAKEIPRPRGVQPEGLDEMVRTAAALEQLEVSSKLELGGWIAERLSLSGTTGSVWAWSLGRLGARAPLYGSSHKTVPPEPAGDWLKLLLENLQRVEGTPFAAVQLARRTGDRLRDLPEDLREQTVQALAAARVPDRWLTLVRESTTLEAEEEARVLGDTLPLGLHLR